MVHELGMTPASARRNDAKSSQLTRRQRYDDELLALGLQSNINQSATDFDKHENSLL